MLQFTPKNEAELFDLLPEGIYSFKVMESALHVSQSSGNQSIKLVLDVKGHEIKCYLSVNYLFLLKHFCDATSLEDAYAQGTLSPDLCRAKTGLCKVIIEQPEEGTNYFPKNVIKDFIKSDSNISETKQDIDPAFNDDLPF